ncbi:MAG: hypothetical protein LBM12_03270 [Candidatus Nomurabacteria bacterium]|jgi:hypothetical protein|nr:hypothetical protein [Candidatus Nomurabacteria bacterium]
MKKDFQNNFDCFFLAVVWFLLSCYQWEKYDYTGDNILIACIVMDYVCAAAHLLRLFLSISKQISSNDEE